MGRGLDGYFYPILVSSGDRDSSRFRGEIGLAVRFSSSAGRRSRKFPVAHSERETPLPIPNRAVKPLSADGTWPERAWESRSPPFN